MPEIALPSAYPPALSAVASMRDRWLRRMRRTVVVLPLLCLCIAIILAAIEGKGFGYKLLYSLLIGCSCMGLVDAMRFFVAWLSDRVRIARGLPYDDSPDATGWRGVIPGALLAMLVGPSLGLWLGDQLSGFRTPSMLDWSHPSTRITLAFSLVATVLSVIGLSTAERLAHARAQAQAAQRLAAENQLRLLQSQLEPHMLFNTLANLRVLIGLDAVRAQAMLDRLINFLRATLSASRSAAHPLSAEFQHLDDYLALMAVRMGPRLSVKLDLPAALAGVEVPPLLLQPLVENCIKHGLEPKVEGGRIEVSARQIGQTLRLQVRDTGVGLAPQPAAGGTSFGLEQVRARLNTLHGAQASLSLQAAGDATDADDADDAEGGTLAVIDLPMPTPSTDTRKPAA